ncbi:uncharacterized protein VTP21DRAFT_6829 [Calcarisporiella thermophila]|uniref:uncharacterized protein n=1 Tax=Calcarisporiella thermophila TaxID=911321 RepID=UPI003742E114
MPSNTTRRSALFPDFLRLDLPIVDTGLKQRPVDFLSPFPHHPPHSPSMDSPLLNDYHHLLTAMMHRRPSMPTLAYPNDSGPALSPLVPVPFTVPTTPVDDLDCYSQGGGMGREGIDTRELAAMYLRLGAREGLESIERAMAELRGEKEDDAEDEERKKSELYRTEMCRTFEEKGYCPYGKKCEYAHSESELRPIYRPWNFKTKPCRTFHEKGHCPYGKRCHYRHAGGPDEIPRNVIIGPPPPTSTTPTTAAPGAVLPSLSSPLPLASPIAPPSQDASAAHATAAAAAALMMKRPGISNLEPFGGFVRRVSDSGLVDGPVSARLYPLETAAVNPPSLAMPRRSAPSTVLGEELQRWRGTLGSQPIAPVTNASASPSAPSNGSAPSVFSTSVSWDETRTPSMTSRSSSTSSVEEGQKFQTDELLPRDLVEQLGCAATHEMMGAVGSGGAGETEEWKEIRKKFEKLEMEK